MTGAFSGSDAPGVARMYFALRSLYCYRLLVKKVMETATRSLFFSFPKAISNQIVSKQRTKSYKDHVAQTNVQYFSSIENIHVPSLLCGDKTIPPTMSNNYIHPIDILASLLYNDGTRGTGQH